jgi:hypothetical protein
MAGYAKLFSSILASTVWDTPPAITKVWITMMAMADQDGVVEASVPGLAHLARVSRQDCDEALRIFLGPDPDSRTPDNDGRRIEVVPGGWRLLNHAEYRDRMSPEDIREKATERKRRQREREAARASAAGEDDEDEPECYPGMSQPMSRDERDVTLGHTPSRVSRHTDTDTESEAGSGSLSLPSSSRSSIPDQTGTRSNPSAGLSPFSAPRPARTVIPVGVKTEAFKAVFERYPRKDGEMKAAVVFADLAASTPGGEVALAKEILAAFDRGMLKRHPYAGPNATRPMLETILAEYRWRDPPSAPDNEPTPVRASSFREL